MKPIPSFTKEETVPFEPWWISPVSHQLEAALEDREMSATQLAELTGIPLCELQVFLREETADLTPAQYLQIETALNLPVNYFARLKVMYKERAEKLNAHPLNKTA